MNLVSCLGLDNHIYGSTEKLVALTIYFSLFRHHVYTHGGCRHVAYTCIGATGTHCAILHYGHAGQPNSKKIEDGDMW